MKHHAARRLVPSFLALLLALPVWAAPLQQSQPELPAAPSGQSSSQAGKPPAPAVGTAAAPYEKSSGITASRPAGAVIAPAKQHRVRRIFIRVGILVGVGAAVGAVALLSHASPSRPQ